MIKYTVQVYTYGTTWCLDGQLHREDGPAVEYADGAKAWYLNGQLHRTDGPAVEHADGGKTWYKNDQLHREDGPAIERANGAKWWYINGVKVTEEEVMKLVMQMTVAEI